MPIDPSTTAVVLIEYQNDFTSEGGVLHGAVEGVMNKTSMLDNTKRVVDAARQAGATVMHAPITFASGYNELSSHPYGILKGVVDSTAFVKGEWGAEIVDSRRRRAGSPQVGGYVMGRCFGEVWPPIEGRCRSLTTAKGKAAQIHRGMGSVAGRISGRQHKRDRAIRFLAAVQQSKRLGDHP